MTDVLHVAMAARLSARQEPLKTKGRVILEFKTPAQAGAALAAINAVVIGGAVVTPPPAPPVVVPPAPPPPPGPDYDARTTAELLTRLKTAKAGSTLVLAPGPYTDVAISGVTFDPPVTIKGVGTVFDSLKMEKVVGLAIEGVQIKVAVGKGLFAWDCKGIRLRGLDIYGASPSGLDLRRCADFKVEDSAIHDMGNGVKLYLCADVALSGNDIYGMASDGIQGLGCQRVTIDGNDFHDFAASSGAHPDAIQFFTEGTPISQDDLKIRNNRIRRGAGSLFQGVLIGDQVGTVPYRRLTVTGNSVEGALYRGISLHNVEGLELSGNTVQPLNGQQSWIALDRVTDGRSAGNRYVKIDSKNAVRMEILDRPSLKVAAGPMAD